jgi:ABC-type branched-subunit amino acid transport system substrate-binding protein
LFTVETEQEKIFSMKMMFKFFILILVLLSLHLCIADDESDSDEESVLEGVPPILTVGGFFNIYDVEGVVDTQALQHMSAFLLAIEEINERSDILPNTTINYVIRNAYQYGPAELRTDIEEMIEKELSAVFSSLSDEDSYLINSITNIHDVTTFNSGATLESTLTKNHPNSFQTSPLESHQGKFMQSYFCSSGATTFARVVLYVSQDERYSRTVNSLTTNEFCTIDVAAMYVFSPTRTEFDTEIAYGIEDASTNIVVIMPDDMAALFLQQAYDQGLIRYGVSVVTSSNILTDSFVAKFSDPVHVLRSVISVADIPEYNVRTTESGKKFLDSFLNQTSTMTTCGSIVDSSGYHYLFPIGEDDDGPCVGLNYTALQAIPSLISYDMSYTYDAVYAWAYAVDDLLKEGESLSSESIAEEAQELDFAGASGIVNFAPGNYLSTYNVGRTRLSGFAYMVYQYQDIYASITDVSVLSIEHGFLGCSGLPDTFACRPPRYNNADNVPSDGYPPYAFAVPPSFLRIAGIFKLYDVNGKPNKDQVESVAAFLMAVNEINNKEDGIFDSLLPATKVKHQMAFGSDYISLFSSADSLFSSYFGHGVTGVVSTLDSEVGQAIDQFLTEINVLQVRSKSSEVKQGNLIHRATSM